MFAVLLVYVFSSLPLVQEVGEKFGILALGSTGAILTKEMVDFLNRGVTRNSISN